MYDPTTGRWLSEDPIGFTAEDMNLYRYVKNDPINATDPSGLQAAPTIVRIGGTAANLADSTFPFGDGMATVRVWRGATARSMVTGREARDVIWMQFDSTRETVRNVHSLQFVHTYQIGSDNEIHNCVYPKLMPGGRRIFHWSGASGRAVDSGSLTDPFYDTTFRNTVRTDLSLAVFDAPGLYLERNTIEEGVVAEIVVIANNRPVYLINWERRATFDGTNWNTRYTARGQRITRMPAFARGNTLPGGFRNLNGNEDPVNPIQYDNPVPPENR
jgi:hypothetical protein